MILIVGLFLLAFGGLLLHTIIHPAFLRSYGFVPLVAGILSVILVPLLFWFRPTVQYAYVINGFLVILGTIAMAHFSIFHFSGPLTIGNILFKTLLADISILWGKFAVGKALFDLELLSTDKDTIPKGRYFRYPNMGWWWVHLLAWSAVYALGNLLWK